MRLQRAELIESLSVRVMVRRQALCKEWKVGCMQCIVLRHRSSNDSLGGLMICHRRLSAQIILASVVDTTPTSIGILLTAAHVPTRQYQTLSSPSERLILSQPIPLYPANRCVQDLRPAALDIGNIIIVVLPQIKVHHFHRSYLLRAVAVAVAAVCFVF